MTYVYTVSEENKISKKNLLDICALRGNIIEKIQNNAKHEIEKLESLFSDIATACKDENFYAYFYHKFIGMDVALSTESTTLQLINQAKQHLDMVIKYCPEDNP